MITIYYGQVFKKEYKALVKRDKKLAKKIQKKVEFFVKNPRYPSLRLHKVFSSKIGEAFSFWIKGDLRILFRFKGKNKVIFYRIGSHKQVY